MASKKQKTSHSKKQISITKTIDEIQANRTGGQIALQGYSYQFLYSCYLIASSADDRTSFQLEGMEDIDCIEYNVDRTSLLHIQLKYSTQKQDASFMKSILKNFLEVYLLDQNRNFKLVYDFDVATGHLSKLIAGKLDATSVEHWQNVIAEIEQATAYWDWSKYSFDDFISKLSFEKVARSDLEQHILDVLAANYQITTDNVQLFANALKFLCFETMVKRGSLTKHDIENCVEQVRFDISKGARNPAHSWIQKISFAIDPNEATSDYYEGKKATPSDIARGLPIRRGKIEKEIVDSVSENRITVIKASSGQGKTTLALQVLHSLKNEYTPYVLVWCNEPGKIGDIIQYFKSRIKLGELPIILIDNLDAHLSAWNQLAQCMQTELGDHYRLLLTARENDWYNFCGDISALRSIKIIKPVLTEEEAHNIFTLFCNEKRIHSSITNWTSAWHRIADRQLLIEYVYLLTHGMMLSERLEAQLKTIGASSNGKVKCDILRKVCFADICGVKLAVKPLVSSIYSQLESDPDEVFRSMEEEFLLCTNADGMYIEGLHPVRSRHIVDILHKFLPLEDTAFSVVTLVRQEDVARFFSHFPEHDINTASFYHRLVEYLWDQHNIDWFLPVMQGLFSGSIIQYYQTNKEMFDDAAQCGGLFILSTELCPFAKFDEFDVSIDTLDKLHEMQPQNQNINHLISLREKMPMCDFRAMPVSIFCTELYAKCSMYRNDQIPDIISYLAIAEWLYNLDPALSLTNNLSLEYIWEHSDCLPIDTLATAMYLSYCSQRETYLSFVNQNMDMVLLVLKHRTASQRVFINQERNAIHVEYFLRLSEIKKANDESVSRLKVICKTLPIFDLYCSDAIKPSLDILEKYTMPDDAHKEMPKRNVVIMFRQNMTSLWNATIQSNYEYDTVGEWLGHWLRARELVCSIAETVCACIYKLLEGKSLGAYAAQFDSLHHEYNRLCIMEALYPRQKRPFESESFEPNKFTSIKLDYFNSLNVLWDMVVEFLKRVDRTQNLLIVNLLKAQGTLAQMQSFFLHLVDHTEYYGRHTTLVQKEERALSTLEMCCRYYIEHQPNKYFGKYSIKTWYQEWYKRRMNDAREALSELGSNFNAVFPVKAYYSGILQYYPIILKDIDITDANAMGKLLLCSIPFADEKFDYLVITFSERETFVSRMCLQLPVRMLKEMKQAIEEDDPDLLESVSYPYPVETTETILECFDHTYRLSPPDHTEPQATRIGDIAEELWHYSKLNVLHQENDDNDYYKEQQLSIWNSIQKHQVQVATVLSCDKYMELVEIVKDVYNGKHFGNHELNEFLVHFPVDTD